MKTASVSFHTHSNNFVFLLFNSPNVISLVDIDECIKGTHNCDRTNALCTDTIGSFFCTCHEGFSGDGVTCSGWNSYIYMNVVVYTGYTVLHLQSWLQNASHMHKMNCKHYLSMMFFVFSTSYYICFHDCCATNSPQSLHIT